MKRKMPTGRRIHILGVPFDSVTMPEAVDAILSAATESAEVRAMRERAYTVLTPNPVMSMACVRDPVLMDAVASASLCIADGVGVVDAARRAGTPLPGRVTGIDTGRAVMAALSRCGGSVYLLGGGEGVAASAAERLKAECPGLVIAGYGDGYFPDTPEGDETVIADILAHLPDLLIVCIGSPRQEKWAVRYAGRLRAVGAVMTLGGALDVWSGKTRRAPSFFIRLRIEWLWRMLSQPQRFRYFSDLVAYRLKTHRQLLSLTRKGTE